MSAAILRLGRERNERDEVKVKGGKERVGEQGRTEGNAREVRSACLANMMVSRER